MTVLRHIPYFNVYLVWYQVDFFQLADMILLSLSKSTRGKSKGWFFFLVEPLFNRNITYLSWLIHILVNRHLIWATETELLKLSSSYLEH